MSRLLKKCLILSVGLHVVLAALLIFGAAFLAAKVDKLPPQLSMIAPDVLDELLNPQSVSNPVPTRQAKVQPQPSPPTPKPPKQVVNPRPPQKAVRPDPPIKVKPKVPKAPTKSPTKPKTPTKKTAPRSPIKIATNTKTAKGSNNPRPNNPPRQPVINSKEISNIKSSRNNLSSAIKVNVTGSNAAAFTTYSQYVVGVYKRTWNPLIPSGVTSTRVAVVSVTVSRTGRVISARITRKSGDAALDRSVQRALDRVKSIGKPFPSGSSDQQRTFTLDFTPRMRG